MLVKLGMGTELYLTPGNDVITYPCHNSINSINRIIRGSNEYEDKDPLWPYILITHICVSRIKHLKKLRKHLNGIEWRDKIAQGTKIEAPAKATNRHAVLVHHNTMKDILHNKHCLFYVSLHGWCLRKIKDHRTTMEHLTCNEPIAETSDTTFAVSIYRIRTVSIRWRKWKATGNHKGKCSWKRPTGTASGHYRQVK